MAAAAASRSSWGWRPTTMHPVPVPSRRAESSDAIQLGAVCITWPRPFPPRAHAQRDEGRSHEYPPPVRNCRRAAVGIVGAAEHNHDKCQTTGQAHEPTGGEKRTFRRPCGPARIRTTPITGNGLRAIANAAGSPAPIAWRSTTIPPSRDTGRSDALPNRTPPDDADARNPRTVVVVPSQHGHRGRIATWNR
jgi:hypothetical protein